MSQTVPFTPDGLSVRSCAEEQGHERRIRTGSGVWICELTTLTPLCIQSYFVKLKDTDPAVIPGTSLRGMVRNIAEILGAGCTRFHADGGRADARLAPCSEKKACIACRVFGFVDGDFAWAGKVRFTDTQATKVTWEHFTIPNTEREPQHDVQNGGWVLFPHGPLPRFSPGPVRCVAARQKLRFRVEYLNLDEEEFAVFKFALTLEYEGAKYCHKIGYAKALGLGACTVSILSDRSPAHGSGFDRYLPLPGYSALRQFRSYK